MKTKKNIFLLLIATLSIVILLFLKGGSENPKKADCAVLIKSKEKISLELAKTQKQQALGLMFRKNLPENKGMLFIFDEQEDKTFWMKNTLIPLDIIFIGPDFKINKIYSKVKPPKNNSDDDNIPRVSARALYVLELAENMSEKLSLKEGEKLKIKFLFRESCPKAED